MAEDRWVDAGHEVGDGVTEAVGYARGLHDAAAMLEGGRQTIRLHAGELSPQEMRAVLAVLGWKRREMLERVEMAR